MKVFDLNRRGIQRVTYEPNLSCLRIEFQRGQTYEYEAVPESIVDWLTRTKDPAGYIRRVITPGFVYRNVTPVKSDGPQTGSGSGAELEALLRASLNSPPRQ